MIINLHKDEFTQMKYGCVIYKIAASSATMTY